MPNHVYPSMEVESSSMLRKLAIVLALIAGLSACVGPAPPYGNPGYGYTGPAVYGPNNPVYYGPGYYPPHTSEHGTVQY